MLSRGLYLAALFTCAASAQTPCQPTPAFTPCDIVFELNDQELKAHPNPHKTVQLKAELRSPRHRTLASSAFWDGGNRMVIRFAPTEDGVWDFRITGNLERFNGKQGQVTAPVPDRPGFLKPANGHHWAVIGVSTETKQPHLWMGATRLDFATMPAEEFSQWLDSLGASKFNHVRGYAIGIGAKPGWINPDQPDPSFYKSLDQRLAQINAKGYTADLILGGPNDHLRTLFPSGPQRESYIRYIAARYAAYNVTWQLAQEFETYTDGRDLFKQLGSVLKASDPYGHPRTVHAALTSAPLLADGWRDYLLYGDPDDHIGSIEHQIYAVPFVLAARASKSDATAIRKQLWNTTMNGQYPTVSDLDSKTLQVWYDFFAATRYWELEPYFDLDGGRALALPGVEYIIYIEKPSGPIEVRLERHGYDVKWVNPATGEVTLAKDFKSERQSFDPPSTDHDWILHISREGRKEGMLRSYKFESRAFLMQDVETGLTKIPYDILQPAADKVSLKTPPRFEAKLKRETRGTRNMMYLWTGESPSNSQGYRILGTGSQGTFRIDKALTLNAPPVLNVRLYGLNANGKLYALDRIFRIEP